jgi:hypothetical protein
VARLACEQPVLFAQFNGRSSSVSRVAVSSDGLSSLHDFSTTRGAKCSGGVCPHGQRVDAFWQKYLLRSVLPAYRFFINSQRHEGWVCLRAGYDDGGFSGATMDRPALQRLLADITAGRVDTVVCTRSTG